MSTPQKAILVTDVSALKSRYPDVFAGSRQSRIVTIGVVSALLGGLVLGIATLDVDWMRFVNGFGKLGEFVMRMLPPSTDTWSKLLVYLHALAETVAIAFLGVLFAAIFAFPFGLLAAKNIVPAWLFHFLTRRFLDTIRGVDELIWALIWVGVVGLGPFAGVLALICANFGVFGKLFSEAIEAADKKPIEGIISAGGNQFQVIAFGILPQVIPILAGQILYYFESNTRSATIIGIVGAGGIGLHLAEQIRVLEYQHVSALILMILITVAIIDFISSRLRFAIIGRRDILA
jgi:phosphonate transport system permease protein